jgi:phosphonoacetaldehyde hydrolase
VNGSSTGTGSQPLRRIRAVVLDWAGTTQDHGSVAPVAAFVEAFRRFGVEISVAEARAPGASAPAVLSISLFAAGKPQ